MAKRRKSPRPLSPEGGGAKQLNIGPKKGSTGTRFVNDIRNHQRETYEPDN